MRDDIHQLQSCLACFPMQFAPTGAATADAAVPSSNATAAAAKPALPAKSAKPTKGVHPLANLCIHLCLLFFCYRSWQRMPRQLLFASRAVVHAMATNTAICAHHWRAANG